MAKYTERILKLNVEIDRSKFFYYLKSFEDGLWLCRSPIMRRAKKEDMEMFKPVEVTGSRF